LLDSVIYISKKTRSDGEWDKKSYLDCYTFVFVGYLDVVDPDIGSPNVNAIQTAFIAATNDHIIQLSVRARIESEMECRSYSVLVLSHEFGGVLTIN
jgi:hypothetical protein